MSLLRCLGLMVVCLCLLGWRATSQPPFPMQPPLSPEAPPVPRDHDHRLSNYLASALRPAHRGHSPQEIVDACVDILWRLADGTFHDGDYVTTIRLDKACFTLDPHFVDAYSVAAWLIWSLGRNAELEGDKAEGQRREKEAIEVLKLCIQNNPNTYESHYELGSFYFDHKRYEEALPLLQKAAQFPCPFFVKHRLAHCYERLGRLDESLAVWRERLKESPDDGVVRMNLERVERKLKEKQGADRANGN